MLVPNQVEEQRWAVPLAWPVPLLLQQECLLLQAEYLVDLVSLQVLEGPDPLQLLTGDAIASGVKRAQQRFSLKTPHNTHFIMDEQVHITHLYSKPV